MRSKFAALYVPSAVGRAALDELDQVPWAELEHAYGTGKLGGALVGDVAATLRRLGAIHPEAFDDGLDALFSNLCHQGTIYRSTAFAVPFLAALVAGADLTRERVVSFVAIFATIGVAASFEAPHGSHAGAHGPGVALLARDALRASQGLLAAAARRNSGLRETAEALAALVHTEPPDPAAVGRLEALTNDFDDVVVN